MADYENYSNHELHDQITPTFWWKNETETCKNRIHCFSTLLPHISCFIKLYSVITATTEIHY
jgi:hypothetical protein